MQPAYDDKPEKKSKHEREGEACASEEESSKAGQVHNALHGSVENCNLAFVHPMSAIAATLMKAWAVLYYCNRNLSPILHSVAICIIAI